MIIREGDDVVPVMLGDGVISGIISIKVHNNQQSHKQSNRCGQLFYFNINLCHYVNHMRSLY